METNTAEWTLNFSGHESFPLRFSWLTKGYKRLYDDPTFFSREDSMVTLGVGKNMVSSIRHWGLTTQSWEEIPGTRGKELTPTKVGHLLLGSCDPYLEHPGTYWVLHWNIVTNPFKATTWGIALNRPSARFSQEQLLQELVEVVSSQGNRKSSSASLKRDIEVFCRSYLQPRQKKGRFQEDELDCPFKQLGLMRPTASKGEFELVVGSRPSLPIEVFEFALLSHLDHYLDSTRKSVAIEDLLYGWNSPGRVFRLSEAALMDRLTELAAKHPRRYQVDETVGLRRFVIEDCVPDKLETLKSYYQSLGKELIHG